MKLAQAAARVPHAAAPPPAIIDIAFLAKGEDGSVAALDVGELKQVAAAFAEFEGASSGLLGYEDLEDLKAQGIVDDRELGVHRRGWGRLGLGSVPPCPGACSSSGPGLLPRTPGELAGGLLELVHPLPGRREKRRADEHEARKPQQATDPDQHPSPNHEAAVDLNAPLGCVIAHDLRPFRRS
jgi:hypothetical protein